MDKTELRKIWASFLIENDITNVDIAKKIGVTRSAISQRINNGTIKFLDFANILDSYGYTIEIRKKDSAK